MGIGNIAPLPRSLSKGEGWNSQCILTPTPLQRRGANSPFLLCPKQTVNEVGKTGFRKSEENSHLSQPLQSPPG